MNDMQARRNFFKTSAATIAAGAVTQTASATTPLPAASADDPYGGFNMSIQSYSLRGFDAVTALKHSNKLGLRFWEAYPRHIPLGTIPKHLNEQKAKLYDAGVRLMAYGVLGFDTNETKAREAFDFAKAMGIRSLSANPKNDKATFDLLDKLVDEYEIAIAIHNHGPGAMYDKISSVEKMVKGRHPLIGACVDTGHFIRSDEDPVDAIKRLGKRVFGVHLKDVRTIERNGKRQKQFTILGQGDLDVPGCLRELRKLKYDYALSLEYEENPDNPLSDIEVCLATVREAVKKI